MGLVVEKREPQHSVANCSNNSLHYFEDKPCCWMLPALQYTNILNMSNIKETMQQQTLYIEG